VFVLKGGEIRGCFPSATGVGEPVEEDRNGWKYRPEGAPTVRCGGSRLHPRGSTTLRFGGSYFATLLGRSHPPGSYQRAGQSSAEDTEIQEPFWANFFYIVYVIGPEVTSPEKTSRLVLGKFFFVLSLFTSGLFSYFHP
jgi:hypothetical protein